jgi:23S rRNA maturation-related 3'-5' exoribonuclease YhaM
MKQVYEVLQQKEAELAGVRKQIEGLRIVEPLFSNDSTLKDVFELLQQKEAGVARVRHEIESLKIVAPLLSEEFPSDEPLVFAGENVGLEGILRPCSP